MPGARTGDRMIRACCSRSTSATRTSRSALVAGGAIVATRRAADAAHGDRRRAGGPARRPARPRRPRRSPICRLPSPRSCRSSPPRSRRSPSATGSRSWSPRPATCRSPCAWTARSEVGADRLVNALAAARLYGTPAVVVDFGTATTLDCVGTDGAYVGGAIAPGLELGLEALAARTAKLPRIELRTPDRAIGRDTVERHADRHGVRLPGAGVGPARPGPRASSRTASATSPSTSARSSPAGSRRRRGRRASTASTSIDPDLTLKGLAILHAEVAGGAALEAGRRDDARGRAAATDRAATGRLEGRLIGLGVTRLDRRLQGRRAPAPLTAEGADVVVMLTPSAARFVGPLTFAALSRHPVETDVLDLLPDQRIGHIVIADTADAIVVAPATAPGWAPMAGGIADDAVPAACLATSAPVVVAPAMDGDMWTHPATRTNVERLRERRSGTRSSSPKRVRSRRASPASAGSPSSRRSSTRSSRPSGTRPSASPTPRPVRRSSTASAPPTSRAARSS